MGTITFITLLLLFAILSIALAGCVCAVVLFLFETGFRNNNNDKNDEEYERRI